MPDPPSWEEKPKRSRSHSTRRSELFPVPTLFYKERWSGPNELGGEMLGAVNTRQVPT